MFLVVGGDSEIGATAAQAMKMQGWRTAATTRRRDRVAPDRPFLDLALPLDSWEPPVGTVAACVCAGVARMAACASDPERTAYINVEQTSALIDKLLAHGVYVLFLSTNQVFDGYEPHIRPDAPYSPISEYGRQKVRTEAALREHMARSASAAILRLAKVISPNMPLVHGWIGELSAGRPVKAFADMRLAPTAVDLVSTTIAALLRDRLSGVFQLTGPRDVSYAAVAHFLAGRLGAPRSLVNETTAHSAGLPGGATPRHTTLDSALLRDRYGFAPPDVWEVVEMVMAAVDKRVVSGSTM